MVWNHNHGDTAFTVPLFDLLMIRVMPGEKLAAGVMQGRMLPLHQMP